MSIFFAHKANISDDNPTTFHLPVLQVDGQPRWVRCLLNPGFTKDNPSILQTPAEQPKYINQFIQKTKIERENPKTSVPALQPHELVKTELCRNFMATGSCRFGIYCKFAHGEDKRRVIMRHPKYKTKPCRNYLQGTCTYGDRCYFIHKWDEPNAIKRMEQVSIYYKHFLRHSRSLENNKSWKC